MTFKVFYNFYINIAIMLVFYNVCVMNNVKNYNCINLWHLCYINVIFFNYMIRLSSINIGLDKYELFYDLDNKVIYKKS